MEVYSKPTLMKDITSLKRYIDDGAGNYLGTSEDFSEWLKCVNEALRPHGLNIDEASVTNPGEFVAFLDIKFCFDTTGSLQTDLHVKETDSRSYLNFSSTHPNHVYSGIVYSQCLRLRRIINCNSRLTLRLSELRVAFINACYPPSMVDNIIKKVSGLTRDLYHEKKKEETEKLVRVVSTFGSDSDIIASVRKFEPQLGRTRSFSFNGSSESEDPPTSTSNTKIVFQLVKKTGSSLRNKHGPTLPCRAKNCKCCEQITDEISFDINGKLVRSAPGSCTTYNIIYLVTCKICNLSYVGRSVQLLRSRIGQHRTKYYSVLRGTKIDPFDDDFALASHLVDKHGCTDRLDFNRSYKVCIIDNSNPNKI